MHLQKTNLRASDDRFDKTSFLAAIGVMSAGASLLLSMAVFLFPEWVSFHALAAASESDTFPLQVVTLRSTVAPIARDAKAQVWTTIDASQLHISSSLQATPRASIPPTAPPSPQGESAGSGGLETIMRGVESAGNSGIESLLGQHLRIRDLPGEVQGVPDLLGLISSATSTGVASTVANVKQQVEANNPVNGISAAEAKSKVDDAAKDATERARELKDQIERAISLR
jgi:hypothetical protein